MRSHASWVRSPGETREQTTEHVETIEAVADAADEILDEIDRAVVGK
jgi:hypothetical protein